MRVQSLAPNGSIPGASMTKRCSTIQRRPEMGAAAAFTGRKSSKTAMGVSTQRGAGVNRLTDAKVRVFADRRGSASKKKLFDRSGRFLTHTKAGTATWRVKYRLRVRK